MTAKLVATAGTAGNALYLRPARRIGSLKILQETLGHSTYQITADIYPHVAPELQQVAADAIDEALRGGGA